MLTKIVSLFQEEKGRLLLLHDELSIMAELIRGEAYFLNEPSVLCERLKGGRYPEANSFSSPFS